MIKVMISPAEEMAFRALKRNLRTINNQGRRRELERVMQDLRWNEIVPRLERFEGLRIVSWNEESENYDCTYAIREETERAAIGLLLHDGNPRKGDKVLYFEGDPKELSSLTMKHVGIWEGDDEVISKWGKGPLIRHPWDLVPPMYGDYVRFSRYE